MTYELAMTKLKLICSDNVRQIKRPSLATSQIHCLGYSQVKITLLRNLIWTLIYWYDAKNLNNSVKAKMLHSLRFNLPNISGREKNLKTSALGSNQSQEASSLTTLFNGCAASHGKLFQRRQCSQCYDSVLTQA